jgi:phage terminase large subunit
VAVICDHDAEDRATLERHLGVRTLAAHKAVSPGIQAVASRLKVAGDGRPRLFLLRDALDERDPLLVEAKRPTCTDEEVESYVWNVAGGRKKGEEPLKENDHGCDCTRYLVAYRDLKARSFASW